MKQTHHLKYVAIATFSLMVITVTFAILYNYHYRNENGPNYKERHEVLIKTTNKHELDSLRKIVNALPADSVEPEYRRALSKER